MTTAVSDSGSLTHLWQIDQWRAFSTFVGLHVADHVAGEVRRHLPLDDMEQYAGHVIAIHEVSKEEMASCRVDLSLNSGLQDADIATIVLAQHVTPDLVLTDDLIKRRAVEACGLTPMGSVGVILRAFRSGLLDAQALDQAIGGLFVHSTLYLSPHFKSYVRRLIAEVTTS